MPQSAEASAETLPSCPPPALPHRQEAFARHVAAGRSLTEAARLAGYAWDSARQTGSRLMKEPHIAARVASIAHAREDQRQGELDELVAALKRLMIDSMARKNDFAALRAIDMIARPRGLTPTTAKRSDSLEAALEEMRHQPAEQAEDEGTEEAAPTPNPKTLFDPPMPPELSPPPAPAPAPEPEQPSPAQARAAAIEAARAEVRRRLFRYEHLLTHHPELSSEIRDLSDTSAYFDDADNLLPPELWPERSGNPGSSEDAAIMTNDDTCGPDGDDITLTEPPQPPPPAPSGIPASPR
jgi:phage terminase small subunit